ncbi:hypothetical protein E0Z10_g4970 [Xylaria hypoxylon]|uniref:Uncharacterized protein n=1 Tax=Xylaria hypoxylon TaxID=37992 RepID=A0A4Z0Z2J4_9PEZI|nr:hypothetical protein E0Z10_g4970 [Xylaria hypoxylon]
MSSGTGSGTSGAAPAEGSSQNTPPPPASTSSTSAAAIRDVVTQAPLVPPSMEFPQPAVLENFVTGPNTLSVTIPDADGNPRHIILEDYDAPTPLMQRVEGAVKEVGVRIANYCLGVGFRIWQTEKGRDHEDSTLSLRGVRNSDDYHLDATESSTIIFAAYARGPVYYQCNGTLGAPAGM